ncbi:MAG: hypothetical protein ABI468_04580 [Candidatus Nanopelagicales bacterium]
MTGPATNPLTGDQPIAVPAVPVVLATRWAQAQAQLFGVLSMQPELYERVVLVLAATMDQLRELAPTTAALLAVQDSVTDVVLDQARTQGLDTSTFDAVQVGQAALAQRLREVRAQESNQRRAAALSAARSGSGWVVLEESGDPEGNVLAPYRRLEADAATGAAVLVSTEPDDAFEGCLHHVVALRVDLDTGVLRAPEDTSAVTAGEATVATRAEREELATRLRGPHDER